MCSASEAGRVRGTGRMPTKLSAKVWHVPPEKLLCIIFTPTEIHVLMDSFQTALLPRCVSIRYL